MMVMCMCIDIELIRSTAVACTSDTELGFREGFKNRESGIGTERILKEGNSKKAKLVFISVSLLELETGSVIAIRIHSCI